MKQPTIKVGEVYEAQNGVKFTVLKVTLDTFVGDYAVTVDGVYGSGRPLGDGCWFLQQKILDMCQRLEPNNQE